MSQHDSTHGGETSGETTSIIGQIKRGFVNDYLYPTETVGRGNNERFLIRIGGGCGVLFGASFILTPFIGILIGGFAGGLNAGTKIALILPMTLAFICMISMISHVILWSVGAIFRKWNNIERVNKFPHC